MTPAIRGSLRLYVVLVGVWVAIWGYQANDANSVYSYRRDYMAAIDAIPGADRAEYLPAALIRDKYLAERNFALTMLLIAPLGLPFAIAAGLWIVAGFRSKDK
jgi:hypothetical protein